MNQVVDTSVPEIAQHQTGGNSARKMETGFPPQWQQRAAADHAEAQPCWRADETRRLIMMHVVHLGKEPPSIQDRGGSRHSAAIMSVTTIGG